MDWKPLELQPRSVYLKPMLHADGTSRLSKFSEDTYEPLAEHSAFNGEIRGLVERDERLKYGIRKLKLVSRILAVVFSITTLVPLAITLAKFFETRDTFFDINGEVRTAWAGDTITGYTYMYFSIAVVSLALNSAIMIAYLRSVKHANSIATVAGWWTGVILVTHVVVWIISAAIYRAGKEPVDGKFRDLWGWTCSTGARELQVVIPNVDFNKYCNIQSFSWYSGLVNSGTGFLSCIIYLLAVLRTRSKRTVRRTIIRLSDSQEPLRS